MLQPARRALLQPARRTLLPSASRPAAASMSRPTAASASRPAALRVAPCCSQRVAPYCSQRIALCCPARPALLQPAHRALLQPARHALLPHTSCPAAASASRPTAARASRSAALHSARPAALSTAHPALQPAASPAQRAACCSVHCAPCPAARGEPCSAEPRRPARAALPNPSRAALPRSPAPSSRPAATTAAAAAARATATACAGAAGSAGSAASAGGAGGATGSAGGAAGAGAARGGQRRSLPLADDPTPQQLREWVLQRACPGGGGFGFLRNAQRRQQSQQETFSPQVLSELFPQRCVTGSVEAAALGACESAAALGASESAAALGASEYAAALGARASLATGPSTAEALHTFTFDLGASRCFFRDCTTLTPLAAPLLVSLADPTGGPVVARASSVLSCLAVPSGSLSGLHLPTFSINLVSNAAIQDVWVDTFIPRGQHVAICTFSRTGRHLVTFARRPGFSLMHSRLLVSGLPMSLPSLPRSTAQPCLLCIEGRQRAAPHSSEFPPTTAPLWTLHMEIWDPAPVGGTDQERYFLLVVDDYTRYTTVFPLRRKADVSGVLIPWIRATRHQLRERFSRNFQVLRLHSDRGGEFSSDLLAKVCRDEGIHQSFMLLASPQQNGIAEHRIGLIMEVARTSMIHAAAPHFLWPFAVRYAAHQLNLWPLVSEPETSPTLRWTGKVGDASVFRVRGIFSLVRDVKASKLSSRTLRCVFLGFPTHASPWHFYHPRSRRGPAPSSVSQVDPPPLVEHLEISSDSSGLVEGGDLAADDTAAIRRSPRLETPPGFPPRPSSPPPQPAAVDCRAETAGAELGGADTEGEGSGGAANGGPGSGGAATGGAGSRGVVTAGAESGGPASPSGGGAVSDPARGPRDGQPPQPDLLDTFSPQAIRAWKVRRGSPGGGQYGPAGARAASPVGTARAGGTGEILTREIELRKDGFTRKLLDTYNKP
ncbi:unnamed protein product [Closterium sp. NIES-53]